MKKCTRLKKNSSKTGCLTSRNNAMRKAIQLKIVLCLLGTMVCYSPPPSRKNVFKILRQHKEGKDEENIIEEVTFVLGPMISLLLLLTQSWPLALAVCISFLTIHGI